MRDFGRWFEETAEYLRQEEIQEVDLPDGVNVLSDGTVEVECCRCGRDFESPVGLEELLNSEYYNYCGGSPHCCP